LGVFLILSSARLAPAEIVLQSSPGTPLPQGNLVQYTISAVGTQGENINVFSAPTINPVSGMGIHNVAQGFTNAGTPTKDEHIPGLYNSDWIAYDSHFLFRSTETLSIGPPYRETNNGATTGMLGLSNISTGPPISGFGAYASEDSSAKGVLPAHAGSNVSFMQVVLRAQDTALMNVRVVANAGAVSSDLELVIGPFIIPEPASMMLAGLAMLGLVGFARRRS
jgi:hypothetical protein